MAIDVTPSVPVETLTSFDRQTRMSARVQRPTTTRELENLPPDCPRIARGAGVSYVAASFDREAVSQSVQGLDRVLDFDVASGRLRVESGISIAAVQRIALRHGWYLPIAPGHARASVGGCIAVDAHGKNPARDGCFRAQLHALRLFHPGHGWLDAPRGSAAWAAAVGGFGLSGLIIEAQLQLAPAPATVALQPIAVESLAAAAAVLDQHRDAMLLYGWHDARPHRFGRGIIRVGHARAAAQQPAVPADTALPAAIRPLPLRLWSPASLALANTWMRWRWQRLRTQSLAAALLPLDGAGPYFAAYGPRGLIEAQWLWPLPRFPELAERLAALVRQQRPLIPLLSSKLFDGAGEGVAFDGKGVALALHVLADARGKAFLRAFNALALAHGGRPNPIKQSGLDAETLRAALPDLDGWRMRLDRVDGERLFRSELSRRLAW